MRYVKALGLLVEGKAQISMNLTDYTHTPIHRVQEAIRVEAARYGCQITHAELIGMIPEQALIDTARWHLQLDLFDENQILEWQVQAAESQDIRPHAFLNAVASGEPTPGGGSAAALAGALAAALAAMVARATIGKKKYAEVEAAMQEVAEIADTLRALLTQAISDDSAAFEDVMAAYRLSKEDPSRPAAIQAAMLHAAEVPLHTARLCVDALKQLQVVAAEGNINAGTDAGAGAHMALAALEAAALNVKVNLRDAQDEEIVGAYWAEISALLDEGRALMRAIGDSINDRLGLD
jgi:glutamate formiminotransferase/formiminotetrahydrofolate cyclodeaminase